MRYHVPFRDVENTNVGGSLLLGIVCLKKFVQKTILVGTNNATTPFYSANANKFIKLSKYRARFCKDVCSFISENIKLETGEASK
jgi:hypothetical protein